jgi:transcriptional regulator with XRE-family HTH domain
MDTLAQRLARALAGPPKISQASLARACRIAAPSVNDWLSGKTQTMEAANCFAAARHLGVNPEWLATGKGPMRLNQSAPEKLSPPDRGSASQPVGLDAGILHEAVTLLLFDLDHGGMRAARSASDLLARLYLRLAEAGGRLPPDEERDFEDQARARGQQKGIAVGHQQPKQQRRKRKH